MSEGPKITREDLEAALEHMGTTLDVTFEDLWKVVGLTLDQAERRQELFGSRECIRDIMKSPVVTCTPDTCVHDAAQTMLAKDIHCLPVVADVSTVVGIVTESDLMYQLSPESADSPVHHLFSRKRMHRSGHTAGDVMTREVIAVHPEDSIEEALHLMIKHGFGRLPVVDGHDLVGIVARKDLLRFVK